MRFFKGMNMFNNLRTVGSLEREMLVLGRRHGVSTAVSTEILDEDRLVSFIAYCLNPNHFHFLLRQNSDKGIEKFMHKLGMGHSKFINAKYKRNGALFQGSFKATHINSNEYLLHASVYINLNNRVHRYGQESLTKSSWNEYISPDNNDRFCQKDIITEQFKDKEGYKQFAQSTLEDMLKRKDSLKELGNEGVDLVYTR